MANEPYITVTNGQRGYFPVLLTWCDEYGGFYEPCLTGDSSATFKHAETEAKEWAEAEGIECKC